MPFLDEKYLMRSEAALAIYKSISDKPVLDLHSHIDIKTLAQNKKFDNVWDLFAGNSTYVWEVLRKRNVDEHFITGDASTKEKWLAMAEVFPEIAGNPVYEWLHFELKYYLGIDIVLDTYTAEDIWEQANEQLNKESMKPISLLESMNVQLICTIDDPIANLDFHEKVNSKTDKLVVCPTWRPDKAINISSPDWLNYMNKIEERYQVRLTSVIDLVYAMQLSHNYFEDNGCITSDYNLEFPVTGIASEDQADIIFNRAITGEKPTPDEVKTFISYMIGEFAEMDSETGWVSQLHMGAHPKDRDEPIENILSSSSTQHLYYSLKEFLDKFAGRLKVALYCMDANQQGTLAELARKYGADICLGSAWWFNETPIGLRRQLEFIGSIDLLSNFGGMTSDSNKILSIGSRFDMFRRVLSDTLANMVDLGQMPFSVAVELAERMAYSGPYQFWCTSSDKDDS